MRNWESRSGHSPKGEFSGVPHINAKSAGPVTRGFATRKKRRKMKKIYLKLSNYIVPKICEEKKWNIFKKVLSYRILFG